MIGKNRIQAVETLGSLTLVLLVLHLTFKREGFLYGGIALLIIALFVKPLAAVLAGWWLKLAEVIAAVNNRVILTVLFYLVLTPTALLYRCFTRNPLRLKGDRNSPSYYTEHDHRYTGEDLGKMW